MSPIPAGPTSIPVPSLALVILDGFGLAPDGPGNAVSQASTPVFDELWATYPHSTLRTSGRDVGLPDGQMGNSEVGHLNLGAGSIVKQDLTRLDDAVAYGSFFENPVLGAAYIAELERWLRRAGRVVTVSGRYYAMDRDRRWERTKLAYDAIVHAEGPRAASAIEAVEESHRREETDEFVRPTVIGDYDGMADG